MQRHQQVIFALAIAIVLLASGWGAAVCASAPMPQPLSLAGDWKIMQGENPSFSRPDYVDTDWQTIEAPANLHRQQPFKLGDTFWYRRWFYLPADNRTDFLALELGKIIGPDETYLNGHLIGAHGYSRFNEPYLGKTRIYPLPQNLLQPGHYNLIAVKVQSVTAETGGIHDGILQIGPYGTILNAMTRQEVPALVFCAVFLVIGFYCLYLFIRTRTDKSYLFMGLGTLVTAVYSFYISQWPYILQVDSFFDPRGYLVTTFLIVPLFLRFTYEIYPKSQPLSRLEKTVDRISAGLLIYNAALCLLLFLYQNDQAWEYMNAAPNTFAILIASVIGILYAATKFDRKDADNILMMCGGSIGFAFGVLETCRQYFPLLPAYIGLWGLTGCIFCLALVLSNRFWRLNQQVAQYSQDMELMVAKKTEQLRHSEESRQRLLSNISHDLRTPVSSVLGHVELMLEGVVDTPEQQRTYLQRIHAKMLGLNRLMHDLFELANLESANARFVWTEISAGSWLDEVWQKYVSDVNNAGFRLEQQNRIDKTVWVRIDTDRLDQVFANLISNAIRFMGSDGKIVISCECADTAQVLFKVADNGSGIAPADIPKVFDRLYRGNHSRGNPSEHSGLGLAITKEIVEAHQGSIWVDETEKKGCTMCILLPAITADH